MIFKLFIFMICLASPAIAEPFAVRTHMPGQELGRYLEILEDKQGLLQLSDLESLRFSPSLENLPNFGPTNSVFWARMTLTNSSPHPIEALIENRRVAPDQQSFYVVSPDGSLKQIQVDKLRPFSSWEIQHRHPSVRVMLAPGSTKVYMRTQNLAGNLQAFVIWDAASFQTHHSRDMFLVSFLFGVIMAMGVYNFFLLVSLRRLDIILYVAFNFSFILWQMSSTGIFTQFFQALLPNVAWNTSGMLAFGQLASIFALGFCSQFLKVWGTRRWIDDLCLGFLALGIFNLLTLAFDVTYLSSLVIHIHVMIAVVLISFLTIRACLQHYRPAYLFLGAWFSLIVGTAITIGSSLAVFPYRVESEWAVFVGAAIESVLLSVALGYKWSYAIKSDADIKKRSELLRKSLDDARAIQQAILPKMQHLPGVTISSSYRSAELIGGDLYGHHYDAVHQRLYFYIGDVTGHGLPSALLSVAVAGAMRSSLAKSDRQHESIALVLDWMAQDLTQIINDMTSGKLHMTMCFCAINLMTLECHYLNAGHNAFYLIPKGMPPQGILRGGTPLGRIDDAVYGKQTLQLAPGDILFFYTDGLTENEGPKGQLLSPRAIKALLAGSTTAKHATDKILAAGNDVWREQPPLDDCTFVAIELA